MKKMSLKISKKYLLKIVVLSIGFILLPLNIFSISQEKKEAFITNHAELLKEYPDLLEKVFGTSEISQITTRENITSKFKNLISESNEFSRIVAASVIAAIAYGIIQDQVTARICLEYFSKGFHEEMMETWVGAPILGTCRSILKNSNSPTVYALIWGTVATWWVGLPLGVLLASSARIGSWPKLKSKELIKPLCLTMAGVGAASFTVGLYGYFANKSEFNNSINAYSENVQKAVYSKGIMKGVSALNGLNFIFNAYTHSAAYATGTMGGVVLSGYVVYKRYQKHKKLMKLVENLKHQLQILPVENGNGF